MKPRGLPGDLLGELLMERELAAAQTGNVDARNGAQRIHLGEGFPGGVVAVDGQDRHAGSPREVEKRATTVNPIEGARHEADRRVTRPPSPPGGRPSDARRGYRRSGRVPRPRVCRGIQTLGPP